MPALWRARAAARTLSRDHQFTNPKTRRLPNPRENKQRADQTPKTWSQSQHSQLFKVHSVQELHHCTVKTQHNTDLTLIWRPSNLEEERAATTKHTSARQTCIEKQFGNHLVCRAEKVDRRVKERCHRYSESTGTCLERETTCQEGLPTQ